MSHELSDLSWPQAAERLREALLVIVPFGATEQHGLHLGVGTDWILAQDIAKKVSQRTGTLLLPTMPYGVSGHHSDFPGTITLTTETFQKVVMEILDNLSGYGIKKIVFINGHGGNLAALSEAARHAREQHKMLCAICMWWDTLANELVLGQPAEAHAGYAETALMMSARRQAVRLQYAVLSPTKQVDGDINIQRAGLVEFKGGLARVILKTADVSDTGSMTEAAPSHAPGTADYSKVTDRLADTLTEKVVQWTCEFVNAFSKFSIPEPHVTVEEAMKELGHLRDSHH